jgi:hypothetical protein
MEARHEEKSAVRGVDSYFSDDGEFISKLQSLELLELSFSVQTL